MKSKGKILDEEKLKIEEHWPNGNIKLRLNYKEKSTQSSCEYYYENGNIQYKNSLKDGKLHGLCEIFTPDGNVIFRRYYFNDKEVTEFEYNVLEAGGEFEDE